MAGHHDGAVTAMTWQWVAERHDAANAGEVQVVMAAGDEPRLLVEYADS